MRRRHLLIRAGVTVAFVRFALWVVSLRSLRRLVVRLRRTRGGGSPRAGLTPEQVAWAVAVVSPGVPRATCLTQALAAQLLLAREGWPSSLRLGVRKAAGRALEAHAFVEVDGRVVLGGPAAGYSTLAVL